MDDEQAPAEQPLSQEDLERVSGGTGSPEVDMKHNPDARRRRIDPPVGLPGY